VFGVWIDYRRGTGGMRCMTGSESGERMILNKNHSSSQYLLRKSSFQLLIYSFSKMKSNSIQFLSTLLFSGVQTDK